MYLSHIVFYLFCAVRAVFSYKNIYDYPTGELIPEECGESYSADRIIGGKNASLGQYPWLAQIGYTIRDCPSNDKPMFRCGGSVISEKYVITAAHCVSKLPKLKCPEFGLMPIRVSHIRLGEFFTHKEEDCVDDTCAAPVQDFKPEKIIVHRHYNKPRYKNDIALIRLNHQINFNGWVAPICLPRGTQLDTDFVGKNAEVAGWGVTDIRTEVMSNFLMYVNVPILDVGTCTNVYRSITTIGEGQLCAGGIRDKDSCQGDSGGPAMLVDSYKGPPKYYLIGLVSFGPTKCGLPKPAVYTRVASYITWMLKNMAP